MGAKDTSGKKPSFIALLFFDLTLTHGVHLLAKISVIFLTPVGIQELATVSAFNLRG